MTCVVLLSDKPMCATEKHLSFGKHFMYLQKLPVYWVSSSWLHLDPRGFLLFFIILTKATVSKFFKSNKASNIDLAMRPVIVKLWKTSVLNVNFIKFKSQRQSMRCPNSRRAVGGPPRRCMCSNLGPPLGIFPFGGLKISCLCVHCTCVSTSKSRRRLGRAVKSGGIMMKQQLSRCRYVTPGWKSKKNSSSCLWLTL